ncbi:MAG: CoA pyrophosphatase [Chloroflexi bacterium]|nr:CoA pyrophosphatase [Chloroflexota bacterium]MCI0580817.1 CoA pyrophosphatase [Chloroflexota bacterium]MCI0648189.1 CoA pyrophosphatase [Chloroflexota bacterium]MCI0730331.1 CoA pyrophosphatase [Chloroflexota bacterium]
MVQIPYSPDVIQQALNLPDFDILDAQLKMVPVPRGVRLPDKPGRPRQGAVLLLLYAWEGETYLVLTRRRDDLTSHAGQISFPGGRREDGEPLVQTALREAYEEVGVNPAALTLLGELSSLYIPPSDYEVHPFVAWHEGRPVFNVHDREVAELLEVPLAHLLDAANRVEEQWEIRGYPVQVPFFQVGEHKVWGATAMMLSEFLERLQALNGAE